MKKKILGLALVSMSFLTFSAMAQSNEPNQEPAKKENVKVKKGNRPEREPQVCPFEGLNLTDAQKSQLQQLDNSYKEACKEQLKAKKEQRQRNDSIQIAERREAQKKYLADVKSILGQDKYVAFLENMYINGQMMPRANKGAFRPERNPQAPGFEKKGDKRPERRSGKPSQPNAPEN